MTFPSSIYRKMLGNGTLQMDKVYELLQDISKRKNILQAWHVYVIIIANGLDTINLLANYLVRLFAECGSLNKATAIFCKNSNPSLHSWHSIISAHSSSEPIKALELYHCMCQGGLTPDKVIFLAIMKACGELQDVNQATVVHDQVLRNAIKLDMSVSTSLINMYSKCGCMPEACKVFGIFPSRDLVMWGAMISGYSQQGYDVLVLEFFSKMLKERINSDRVTFSCALKACGNLRAITQGTILHDLIIRTRFETDAIVSSSLVIMYSALGSLEDAIIVFNNMLHRDVVSWSAMVKAYADHGKGSSALECFGQMLQARLKPDEVTFLSVLRACVTCDVSLLNTGRTVHDQIIRSGLDSEIEISNTLVHMYAKYGNLQEARRVFETLLNRSQVTWEIIFAAYAQSNSQYDASLELLEKMQKESFQPSPSIYSNFIKACSSRVCIDVGRNLHNHVVCVGLECDVMVGNALVCMYVKWVFFEDSHKLFNAIRDPDITSWSVLITGYTEAGLHVPAIDWFAKMIEFGLLGDGHIYSSVLKSCGRIESSGVGRLIHDQIIQIGIDIDNVIQGTLIDMYVKHESLEDAHKVFDKGLNSDLVSWNTLMQSYVQHEQAHLTLDLYSQMLNQGLSADKVTFLCVLKACGVMGAIYPGRLIYSEIVGSGLGSDVAVCNSVIDMYCKCSRLGDARQVFDGLGNPNVVSWNAMIAGYSHNNMSSEALECFRDMLLQDEKPNASTYLSVLGACSHANQVEPALHYFLLMSDEHKIPPSIEHLDCLVDLLGRSGFVSQAEDLLETIPQQSDDCGWTSLLSACKTYDNMNVGIRCFEQLTTGA